MTTTSRLADLPQPDYQEVADLGAILSRIHPHTYTPTGDMAERIRTRLKETLSEDGTSEAIHVLGVIQLGCAGNVQPDINFWADDLTAPHISLTEYLEDGSARLWRIRLAAAGVVYVDGQYHYYPAPGLDGDDWSLPVHLGTDDWNLRFR